jgi:hypothetical protein
MTGSVLICAMLAVGAAPEPRLPANETSHGGRALIVGWIK